MKQKPEETTIKELFQRLKQEDERHAPPFTDSWAAAQSRVESFGRSSRVQSWKWSLWSLAAAVGILIICGLVYYTVQNGSVKDNSVMKEKSPAPQPSVEREDQVAKVAVEPEKRPGLRPRQNRRANRSRFRSPFIREEINFDAKNSEYTTDFFMLRFGDDHLPMESGEVIRVQMPRSAFITLGLPVNFERADELVKADLLIGEDGLARAIRFVR